MKSGMGILGLLLIISLLGCSYQPTVVINKGVALKAGQTWDIIITDTASYNVQIRSGDAVTIRTYATNKDVELAHAGSTNAELIQGCNADQSTYYNEKCNLPKGAVLEIKNPNFLQSIDVNVMIVTP